MLYTTELLGVLYSVRANWTMPHCPVESLRDGQWRTIGRTVADCLNRPGEAMLHVLVQSIIESGREPEEFDAEISAALDGMAGSGWG